MPPAIPTASASTTTPNASRRRRTPARPPLSPNTNVPVRLSTTIRSGSNPGSTSGILAYPDGPRAYDRPQVTTDPLSRLPASLGELADVYRDLHAHPELSAQ